MSEIKKHNRFQKTAFGSNGCYTCSVCGKKTRETGEGESNSEMCAFCFNEAMYENSFNNDEMTQKEFDEAILELKKKYNR